MYALRLRSQEYQKIQLGDIKIEFICDSNLVNNKGRVLGQENESKLITYTVKVTYNGVEETITLASIIEGTYNK